MSTSHQPLLFTINYFSFIDLCNGKVDKKVEKNTIFIKTYFVPYIHWVVGKRGAFNLKSSEQMYSLELGRTI
jgi:hypothetical protein